MFTEGSATGNPFQKVSTQKWDQIAAGFEAGQ
jgi:hypothetical protein